MQQFGILNTPSTQYVIYNIYSNLVYSIRLEFDILDMKNSREQRNTKLVLQQLKTTGIKYLVHKRCLDFLQYQVLLLLVTAIYHLVIFIEKFVRELTKKNIHFEF